MRLVRLAIGTIGVTVMAFGAWGAWNDRIHTRPWLGGRELWWFWLGGALVHDLVAVPMALAVASVVAFVVPRWARPAIGGALFATLVVVVVSLPAWRGYGRRPGNPSLLPRDYGTGLLAVLALVWAAAAMGALWSWLRQHRAGVA